MVKMDYRLADGWMVYKIGLHFQTGRFRPVFLFALQKTSRENAACCVQMRSVDQTIHEGYTNRSQARMEVLTAFCFFVLIKIGVKYQKKA